MQQALGSAGIEYMVVGSFASSVHGVPRTTHDLDLVIDPSPAQLDALVAALDPADYYVDGDVARDALSRRSMFNVIDMHSGWKIDFVIRKDRPFSIEELARRIDVPVFDVVAPLATAEDTIIAKLEWARDGQSDRQLDDVAGILRVRGGTLDRAYLDRWIGALGLGDVWQRAQVRA